MTSLLQDLETETELARYRAENARLTTERDMTLGCYLSLLRAAAAMKTAFDRRVARLEHERDELRRQLYGQKSERDEPRKGGDEAPAGEKPEPAAGETPASLPPPPALEASPKPESEPRKGHGWSEIPKDLPRTPVTIEPDAEDLVCDHCGCQRTSIGAPEITERIDYEPRSVVIAQTIRPRYRCPRCVDGTVIAKLPPAPLEPKTRGRAEAGLLAYLVDAKFARHLPLHRVHELLVREGVHLSKSTLGDWTHGTAELLRPVADAVLDDVLTRHVVGFDATGLRVLLEDEKDPEAKRKKASIWVYRGLEGETYFKVSRTGTKADKDGPLTVLAKREGLVQADAAKVFDDLFKDGKRIEAGCRAHERRGYHAAKKSSPREARYALEVFKRIYAIEERVRDASPEVRLAARQNETKPILDAFDAWVDELATSPALVPGTPLAKAVGYSRNHREALRRFLDDPLLSPDNNAVERALRLVAVGRKNYLFCGSEQAARNAAALYTLVAGCRELGIDPWVYFRDVIRRRAADPRAPVKELTPREWWLAQQAADAAIAEQS